ncbi:hypothetical protein B0H14DRAFT_3641068 [Mycena olivaceomarginata]|nr:hypothetical protein B0H14DRAFT_3641068 [Mycena olivaceomarginata]
MGKSKQSNKENEPGNTEKTRARWNTSCDSILIAQLIAQKAAGNQTDNAGWHKSAWTACAKDLQGSEKASGGVEKSSEACQTRWGTLKSQYQLVKGLHEKSGWGWNDEAKHIVVDDATWDAYVRVNGKVRGWRFRGFPLYDELAQLVDGAVATGAGAFNPGQVVARAPSPDWPEKLPEDDDDDDDSFPLDPVLKGPAGRSEDYSEDGTVATTSPVSSRRVRALSDPPSTDVKRRRTDGHGHGRKPSNGSALLAVSESLNGIAAALQTIKLIMQMAELGKEEKTQILRLIRADTGIADTFLAIEDDVEARIDYLRAELQP